MASRRKQRSASREPGPPSRPVGAPARGIWIRAALIALAGAIVYANALAGPFVLDDQDTIVLNQQIRDLSPSVVLFPALELPVAGRPLVNLSFALNYAFGGLDVRGYHAVNVAIHIACGLLLFGIVRRTFGTPPLGRRFESRSTDLAFATALIWLVHPLATDAVDYVTQRTELLMGLFYFLTLYASIRALDPRGAPLAAGSAAAGHPAVPKPSGRDNLMWSAIAVCSCALGMASKESMVTAPLMVVIYDRVFLFDTLAEAWRRRGRFYLALGATWGLLAAVIWSGPRFRSAGFSTNVTPWTYLLNQTVMIVRYLRLAFWPNALVVDYGAPQAMTIRAAAPYAVVVVACLGLTVWALRYAPVLGFLGAWFFITLSPTSSIVPIATEVGAERRMYLPLAALVVLAIAAVAWLLERLATRLSVQRAHAAGLLALAVIAVGFSAATMARNREYASAVSLARTSLERWPTDRARHSLGAALILDEQYTEGIEQLRLAIAGEPAARYTLGVALFKQGKLDEAVQNLQAFVEHDPTRFEAPAARTLIGRALKARGRFPEAADEFRRVLAMTPGDADVHGLLAECLWRQQKFDEAIGHYQQYLPRHPNDLAASMQLGVAYAAVGWREEAIAQFRRVVELNPRDGGAHGNLAQALLDKGSFDEAAPHAQQAVQLNPQSPLAHHQLALALAGQHRLDDAIGEFRRAAQLDPANAEIRTHLELALSQRAKEGPGTRP
jgi:protein O-mannosyl-transferase